MRIIKPLNFDWKYKSCFKDVDIEENSFEHYEQVNIPHSNIELPYNNFNEETYAFISCYKKVIKISDDYRDKDIFISFEGVANYAKVYVNGQFAGEHKGGYTPFDIKIDNLVSFNEDNVITVVVDSTEREEVPPFGNVVDYLTYGGIYREVSLKILDKIHIDNIFIKTEDVLKKNKKINIEIQLSKKGKRYFTGSRTY